MISRSTLRESGHLRLPKPQGLASCLQDSGSFAVDCPRILSSTDWKPMSDVECFFDTSVLIYLLSSEPEKADRVESLLANSGTISVQVLNEFTSVATRKFGMSLADVRETLDTVRTLCH